MSVLPRCGTAGSGPTRHHYEIAVDRAMFDCHFGFLALYRGTRLVLAPGWVTDPVPYDARTRAVSR
ncbi:hypothetical protein OG905_23545 [Streptomyces sp. NBC_00322]|uniref:hypothetical protein n=1 Tax=Streptomyces sp. NBC_00322 TaxID=2975712 RepID=UPI002E27EF60|nr:hypothetical protein [Streptomyces sp. NBC_00322]